MVRFHLMALPVPLELVVEELETLQAGMLAYVHRKTGELVTLTEEMQDLADEDDDTLSDVDTWGEVLPPEKLREILDSADWVALPDPFKIHEWEIMRTFADTIEDPRRSEELQVALRGQGAFRRFKDILTRYQLLDGWYDYKRRAIEKIAREALEEIGIPYA